MSKKTRRTTGAISRRKRRTSTRSNGLTRDQKLDVLGVLLALTGILLLLALFSPINSPFVRRLVEAMQQLLGLGRFAAPIVCIATGTWVMLRHFSDQLPYIRPEQVIGSLLLFLSVLTSLSADEGSGGALGQYLLRSLVHGLGPIGALIALVAWLFVALILTLGTSIGKLLTTLGKASAQLRSTLKHDNGKTGQQKIPLQAQQDIHSEESKTSAPNSTTQEPGLLPKRHEPTWPSADHEGEGRPLSAPKGGKSHKWTMPRVEDILAVGAEMAADDEYDRQRAKTIEETLESFGAPVLVVEINRGPTITQFGVEPDFVTARSGKRTKVKVNKISALADDLALALAAASIRIEAPVPGKGFIGVEVPNANSSQVALRDLMASKAFKKLDTPLALCLGQDVAGRPVCADLAAMPHLLIAGTTGSGKSVCVNAIIATLLLRNAPSELKILMIDPKRVELTAFRHIPHLLVPVIVDLNKVVPSLQWMAREMDNRYTKFAETGARNIEDFNQRAIKNKEAHLPYLVVVVDELADLMMVAPEDTERIITRLAQMARATGIHLIIATQRPSVDVVTGLIKANFPARVAFAVASSIDSRVILDQPGAERLLGRGDMLFQAPDAAQPLRMQGTFVADGELRQLVRHWKGLHPEASPNLGQKMALDEVNDSKKVDEPEEDLWEDMQNLAIEETRDDLFSQAVKTVRADDRASISMLQRRLRIGYSRAAKLIDAMEEAGIVGPAKKGAKQREVLHPDMTEAESSND